MHHLHWTFLFLILPCNLSVCQFIFRHCKEPFHSNRFYQHTQRQSVIYQSFKPGKAASNQFSTLQSKSHIGCKIAQLVRELNISPQKRFKDSKVENLSICVQLVMNGWKSSKQLRKPSSILRPKGSLPAALFYAKTEPINCNCSLVHRLCIRVLSSVIISIYLARSNISFLRFRQYSGTAQSRCPAVTHVAGRT